MFCVLQEGWGSPHFQSTIRCFEIPGLDHSEEKSPKLCTVVFWFLKQIWFDVIRTMHGVTIMFIAVCELEYSECRSLHTLGWNLNPKNSRPISATSCSHVSTQSITIPYTVPYSDFSNTPMWKNHPVVL